MTKQVSGHCGVGKLMKLWKFWEESRCHSCGAPVEDVPHTLLPPCRLPESLG
jgi:hypothetical protein